MFVCPFTTCIVTGLHVLICRLEVMVLHFADENSERRMVNVQNVLLFALVILRDEIMKL